MLATLASCGTSDDPARTRIALIGPAPSLPDPDRRALGPTDAVIARETAQGLVRLDASGQIGPGLAESWIMTDDGRSAIFRIRRSSWPGGREIDGDDVAASLKRAVARDSRNALKPLLTSVETVVGMTGRVVEIRLRSPRPNLLQLLAQPELGIRRRGAGTGPWRVAARSGGRLLLRPAGEAVADTRLEVTTGRAARAIAAFAAGREDAVLGGTFADWPLVGVADIPASSIRIDPAEGLFGLAVNPRTAFLRDREVRRALARSIDRIALVTLFDAQRWKAEDRLLPSQLDSAQAPAQPPWSSDSPADRLAAARILVARWIAAQGPVAPLRVAGPQGPGMRLLIARLNIDWAPLGLSVVAAPAGARDADFRLIDAVAPNMSANWYLTMTGCAARLPCSEAGEAALAESRAAPTLEARAAAIARADAAYAEVQGFIPIAKPLRWSLVAPRLTGFRENSFAVHPLGELREAN